MVSDSHRLSLVTTCSYFSLLTSQLAYFFLLPSELIMIGTRVAVAELVLVLGATLDKLADCWLAWVRLATVRVVSPSWKVMLGRKMMVEFSFCVVSSVAEKCHLNAFLVWRHYYNSPLKRPTAATAAAGTSDSRPGMTQNGLSCLLLILTGTTWTLGPPPAMNCLRVILLLFFEPFLPLILRPPFRRRSEKT